MVWVLGAKHLFGISEKRAVSSVRVVEPISFGGIVNEKKKIFIIQYKKVIKILANFALREYLLATILAVILHNRHIFSSNRFSILLNQTRST